MFFCVFETVIVHLIVCLKGRRTSIIRDRNQRSIRRPRFIKGNAAQFQRVLTYCINRYSKDKASSSNNKGNKENNDIAMGSNNSKSGLERFVEMKNTLLRQTPEPPNNEPPSSSEDTTAEAAAHTEQVTTARLKLG